MTSETDQPPTVGTLAEYTQDPFRRRREWSEGQDVVTVVGPDENHHLVVHPEYIQRVLVTDDDQYEKYGAYDPIFGEGLVSVYDEQWRAQRGALQSAFTPDRVNSYCETIQNVVRSTVEQLEDGQTVDMLDLSTRMTAKVMLETLFGGAGDRTEPVTRVADQINNWFMEMATAGDVPDSTQSEFEQGRKELISLVDQMIEEREGDIKSSDILSMLIAMGPDHEAEYTDGRIRDEMITLFFGAHETTALTLTYTLFLLADAPEVGRKLRSELDEVLDGDSPGAEHVQQLSYTEQVINEAMRLYSPAHSLFREATADVEIGPYTIPAGDIVYLPQCVVHRDERWWDSPETFRPERFDGESNRHPFVFFPFGAGPRRCIGERFARAEANLAVATLTDTFQFEQLTQTFDQVASLTAVPDRPIKMSVHRR